MVFISSKHWLIIDVVAVVVAVLALLLFLVVWSFGRGRPFVKLMTNELPETNPKIREAVVDATLDIAHRMEQAGVSYVADSGTLLGAARDGGMIPWDDDSDLIIPAKDENKMSKLVETLPPEWKSIKIDGFWALFKNKHGHVDIFMTKQRSDKKWIYAGPAALMCPNNVHEPDAFSGKVKNKWEKGELFTPPQVTAYLDRAYPGWGQIACTNGVHSLSILGYVQMLFKRVATSCKVLDEQESFEKAKVLERKKFKQQRVSKLVIH
jgi:hypothetical protein